MSELILSKVDNDGILGRSFLICSSSLCSICAKRVLWWTLPFRWVLKLKFWNINPFRFWKVTVVQLSFSDIIFEPLFPLDESEAAESSFEQSPSGFGFPNSSVNAHLRVKPLHPDFLKFLHYHPPEPPFESLPRNTPEYGSISWYDVISMIHTHETEGSTTLTYQPLGGRIFGKLQQMNHPEKKSLAPAIGPDVVASNQR